MKPSPLLPSSFLTLIFCWLANAGVLPAADWPQWRGINRDGLSAETGLVKEWPKEGPKLLWQKNEVGEGYSTPAVVGDRIYFISNNGMNEEIMQAFDAHDGKKVWSAHLGKVGANKGPQYPGSRSTPTVDAGFIYALGSDGDLVCAESATGKIRWQKNLRRDYGGVPGNWAYAESPLVDANNLICTPGGKEATLIALNKKTGEVIWKATVPGGDEAAYASAIVVSAGGVRQYVQFVQKGLVSVDTQSGKFLWRYDKTAQGSPANIPTPVAADGYVYSAAGRSGGGLVKLKGSDGKVEIEQVYFSPKLPTAIGGAVKVGEYLYGTTGQALVCADFKKGDLKWEERSVAPASICYAEGRLYLHGENGEIALVEATPEAFREKGRFMPPSPPNRGRTKAWAYPVIADGRLFIRDLNSLWCYDIRSK